MADAGSGPLALALFPLFKPHLMILDILTPEIGGLEVLRQMKQWDPNVFVIMLIGVDDLEVGRNGGYPNIGT